MSWWKSMIMEISGSGSGFGSFSQRHGSADLDPDPDSHQNVMDPQHCYKPPPPPSDPWNVQVPRIGTCPMLFQFSLRDGQWCYGDYFLGLRLFVMIIIRRVVQRSLLGWLRSKWIPFPKRHHMHGPSIGFGLHVLSLDYKKPSFWGLYDEKH